MQPTPENLSPPLVTLSGGRQGIRGGIHVEISEPQIGGEARSLSAPGGEGQGEVVPCCLDFISSDETLDRYQEVISASGWRLENYQRNPIFQNNHQTGDIIHTIGRALITEVRKSSSSSSSSSSSRPVLYQRIQFAVEANPIAKIAYALYRGKFLNAVSVGFVPVRWVDGDGKEYSARALAGASNTLSAPGTSNREAVVSRGESESRWAWEATGIKGEVLCSVPNSELRTLNSELTKEGQGEVVLSGHQLSTPNHQRSPKFRRKYLEQVSAVGIPANPNALALAYKSAHSKNPISAKPTTCFASRWRNRAAGTNFSASFTI